MAKNIVLCSDGTGNRGGKGQGTNVWRIYHAIDRNSKKKEQVAFYDDGVGTEDYKYLRYFSGATGFGFTRNVKDLYRLLVLNYDDMSGDGTPPDIYLFGFSRGAYTVRALAAFVASEGIIQNAQKFSERDLDFAIQALVCKYRSYWRKPFHQIHSRWLTRNRRNTDYRTNRVRIKCIGVWDTVSAIGVPFDIGLKKLILKVFCPFRFHDYSLSPRVDYAFHAVSIDDRRKTFHPELWNEDDKENRVEQVWFSGVHSNVGGGYPKQGMSYVTLDWMMERTDTANRRNWGLHFDKPLRDEARHEANVHDKLYDSRSGVLAFYRYSPRDMDDPTPHGDAGKPTRGDETPVRIHESALRRIASKTRGYNPGNLPCGKIKIDRTRASGSASPDRHGLDSDVASEKRINKETIQNQRREEKNKAAAIIHAQKALHLSFVFLCLFIAAAAGQVALRSFGLNGAWLFTFPSILTIVALVTLVLIPKCPCMAVSALAFAATSLFWIRILPSMEDTTVAKWIREFDSAAIYGEPLNFWPWACDILQFLLPDLLANLIVDFIATMPNIAALVFGLLLLLWLGRILCRRHLAVINEQIADTVR